MHNQREKKGYDEIDINCIHLTLLNEFLSIAFNKSNNEYDGNDENKGRIIIEIIEKVRKVVGNNFIKKSDNYAQYNVKPKSFIYYEETKKISEVVNISILLIGGIRDIETKEEVLNKSNIQNFLELVENNL